MKFISLKNRLINSTHIVSVQIYNTSIYILTCTERYDDLIEYKEEFSDNAKAFVEFERIKKELNQ